MSPPKKLVADAQNIPDGAVTARQQKVVLSSVFCHSLSSPVIE